MLLSLFLFVFLPCVSLSLLFIFYVCFLWFTSDRSVVRFRPTEKHQNKGLSNMELQKLPSTSGGGELNGTECAVCLDEIEVGQPARLLPGCHHGFHLKCADAWLSKNSVCPVCRAKLEFPLVDSDENLC